MFLASKNPPCHLVLKLREPLRVLHFFSVAPPKLSSKYSGVSRFLDIRWQIKGKDTQRGVQGWSVSANSFEQMFSLQSLGSDCQSTYCSSALCSLDYLASVSLKIKHNKLCTNYAFLWTGLGMFALANPYRAAFPLLIGLLCKNNTRA